MNCEQIEIQRKYDEFYVKIDSVSDFIALFLIHTELKTTAFQMDACWQ